MRDSPWKAAAAAATEATICHCCCNVHHEHTVAVTNGQSGCTIAQRKIELARYERERERRGDTEKRFEKKKN